jgi:hypothetical protein
MLLLKRRNHFGIMGMSLLPSILRKITLEMRPSPHSLDGTLNAIAAGAPNAEAIAG